MVQLIDFSMHIVWCFVYTYIRVSRVSRNSSFYEIPRAKHELMKTQVDEQSAVRNEYSGFVVRFRSTWQGKGKRVLRRNDCAFPVLLWNQSARQHGGEFACAIPFVKHVLYAITQRNVCNYIRKIPTQLDSLLSDGALIGNSQTWWHARSSFDASIVAMKN